MCLNALYSWGNGRFCVCVFWQEGRRIKHPTRRISGMFLYASVLYFAFVKETKTNNAFQADDGV